MATVAETRALPRLPHPYRLRVKRRYLHQLLRYWRPLRRERARLCRLMREPLVGEVGPLLHHAWDHIPFYRRRMREAGLVRADLADPTALQALRPLERWEVQEHRQALIDWTAPRAVRRDVYQGLTSGSTGEPVTYLADGFSYLWFWAFVDFVLRYTGANTRFRPLSMGVTLLCALGHSPAYGSFLPLFHGTFFRKLHVTEPGFREQIERARPQVVTGDPDSLAALLDVRLRPRLVLSSAFAMPPALRQRLATHLGCPVVEYYSAAETGMIGVACQRGYGYHLLTPAVAVEAVEVGASADGWADGEGVEPAIHELLVTNLRNRYFPLIRYRLGDLGAIEPVGPLGCACGLHAPLITELRGRTTDLFTGAEGGRFDPSGLSPVLARLSIRQFQVIEQSTGRYRIRYLGGRPLAESERALITSQLARLCAGGGAAPDSVSVVFDRLERPLRERGVKPRPFIARPGDEHTPDPDGTR